MYVKILTTVCLGNKTLHKGDTIEVTDAHARELINKKLATESVDNEQVDLKPEPEPEPEPEAAKPKKTTTKKAE